MTPDDTRPPSRQKVLFLSFTYPTLGGSGSQLRAASLVRMLAAHAEVHLLIASWWEKVTGPRDPSIERLCQSIAYLRMPPIEPGKWPLPETKVEGVDLPTIDRGPTDSAVIIHRHYLKYRLDSLFVFRLDALQFVHTRLDFFPVRHLDLDELPSRSQAQIARLKRNFEPETPTRSQKTVQATTRLMEKTFISRFHRVFVASAVEAEEVRRQTGFQQPVVLPNVYPARLTPLEKRTAARSEILFVGSLFYYPNIDAVLYFCREILPLIQEKKGDGVLFRIVGMGSTDALDCVKDQRGVDLVGYQKDLAPLYTQATLVVVPLRAGAGTRLKILEAFVHERVVVSTSIGAEGLEVTDRKNILLADHPHAFAQACIEMIDQPKLAEKIAGEAARLHRERYSEEELLRCYAKIREDEPVGKPESRMSYARLLKQRLDQSRVQRPPPHNPHGSNAFSA